MSAACAAGRVAGGGPRPRCTGCQDSHPSPLVVREASPDTPFGTGTLTPFPMPQALLPLLSRDQRRSSQGWHRTNCSHQQLDPAFCHMSSLVQPGRSDSPKRCAGCSPGPLSPCPQPQASQPWPPTGGPSVLAHLPKVPTVFVHLKTPVTQAPLPAPQAGRR